MSAYRIISTMSGTATYVFFVWTLMSDAALSFYSYNQPESGLKIEEATTSAEEITFHGDQNLCPQRTFCTVLTECRLLMDLMDRTCLMPNRLKELICGYHKTEAMVCCPHGGNVSPFTQNYYNGGHAPKKNISESNKLNQNCGRPHLNGWRNGYSGIGSQPWVAKIGYKGLKTENINYPCCGSIVTNKVVLTAAHCALAEPSGYSLHSVRVGDYDVRTDPDCTASFCAHPAQDIHISHVVVHPGYEKGGFRHDVALLILKTPITYSVAAQPICLLQNPNVGLVGRKGKLIGWGKLAGQDVAPGKEQQIELPVISLEHCSKIYGRVIPITSSHLCVGGEAKKDACSGFGGAPFVLLDHLTKDRYYQAGMLSFGSDKCGSAGVPSVYTRIQHYYDWINANIPD